MIDKDREKWLDFTKLVAIVAVILDHSYEILYKDFAVQYFSFFSVGLFIICMGVTSYWSNERKKWDWIVVKNKIIKILIPYVFASAIYLIMYEKRFDLSIFVDRLIHFNACPPLYFVLLYVQLLLIAPLLLFVLSRGKILVEIVMLPILVVMAIICTNYSNILDVYGGGGKLFGGTYVILFYLGMLFAKHKPKELRLLTSFIFLVKDIILVLIYKWYIVNYKFSFDELFPFGIGLNPPGISLMSGAIIMFLFSWNVGEIIQKVRNRSIRSFYVGMCSIGRHTLYIYFYHYLLLELCIIMKKTMLLFINKWIMRLLCFLLIILGSLIIEELIYEVKKKLFEIYNPSKS